MFGTGRATTTDTVGLNGEINSPIDSIYDPTENYLYLSDQNGGGLIRKLAVTNQYSSPFASIFYVKTVFVGTSVSPWYRYMMLMLRRATTRACCSAAERISP